jgi:hypothetical protein
MPRVPFTADFQLRQVLAHVGLDESTPMPTQRKPVFGIGAPLSGGEVNPPPRPKPPASHMRLERPAPPRQR